MSDPYHVWAYYNKDATNDRQGVLSDVRVGVKDIFNTIDMPTQMGSPIWKDFTPGNDARVVHSLRMAGAVIPGKTVTAEFAVHTPGPTRNPHNPEHSPGTSSSGSAAAVALGEVPMALGTQTAGSIIRPASYCGVLGFKPTFGLIPRTGMLKTTDTLDTVGMFADTVDNLRLLFDVIRVHGRDYPFSSLDDKRDYNNPKLVIGPKYVHAQEYVKEALEDYEPIRAPHYLDYVHYWHGIIYDKTLAYYFKDEFKQETLVSDKMYEIIERGNKITLDEYKEALSIQAEYTAMFDEWMDLAGFDLLIDFSTSTTAPLFGEDDEPDNCLVWTFLGLPVVNVPLFCHDGLPFGVQVVGRKYNDYKVLRYAKELLDG